MVSLNNFLKIKSPEDNFENADKSMIYENLRRGKVMALALILFEFIFALINMISSIITVHTTFAFGTYFLMYLLMIFINIDFLLFANKALRIKNKSLRLFKKIETRITLYITALMCWGSLISLMDQRLYGQIVVFMVNMISCSVVFILNSNKIIIPYLLSTLILFIGLPFFQSSKEVLIGHYVNIFVFIVICFLTSRILYENFCQDFQGRNLLKKTNELLEKEVEYNNQANLRLTETNLHLKQLSLVDELTGIPNRRFFRNFVDFAFENFARDGSLFSVIIIDIDYFKGFNDCYGHSAGDEALILVAKQINSVVVHSTDFAVRWGGEEFLYASFTKNLEEAIEIAESIRNKILALKIPHEASTACENLSISLGVSSGQIKTHKDISRSITSADKALYTAKINGRNCVRSNNLPI